jgi:hypothetical protein
MKKTLNGIGIIITKIKKGINEIRNELLKKKELSLFLSHKGIIQHYIYKRIKA